MPRRRDATVKQPRPPTTQRMARDSSPMGGVPTGDEDRTKTMAVRVCRACCAGLLENDNFCRWCGARQNRDLTVYRGSQFSFTSLHQKPSSDHTRSLMTSYHPVSGPLVQAIAENVSANLSSQRRDRVVRRVVLALVSIPIWLLFVLLSPFDAYTAARNVTKGA